MIVERADDKSINNIVQFRNIKYDWRSDRLFLPSIYDFLVYRRRKKKYECNSNERRNKFGEREREMKEKNQVLFQWPPKAE